MLHADRAGTSEYLNRSRSRSHAGEYGPLHCHLLGGARVKVKLRGQREIVR